MPRQDSAPTAGATLATLDKGCTATIAGLRSPGSPALAEHLQRLMEIGFLPGTPVRVIATGFPARDPIAVRIGRATFALRRFEADLIEVVPAVAGAQPAP